MKTVSDDLFRLVKALNKSEKGYFKKFAAKNATGGKQNYLVLFDTIDSMDVYDEELLRKKLKGETFIKQLPVYKVYLFNLILKSLNHYGAYDNSNEKIKELIENAKTLNLKGLHKEALKLLKKAKELAVKYKKQSQLLEILIAERNILIVVPDKNVYQNREKIYNELNEFTKSITKYTEYSWLADRMLIIIEQRGDINSSERAEEIKKILSHPYMSDERLADDYVYKSYYHNAHLMHSISSNDLNSVYNILKNEIRLIEENMHLVDDNPKNYLQALINFLLTCNFLKKKEDIRQAIQKLNALRRRMKNKVPLSMQIQLSFHGANAEMMIYRNNCDMKRGRSLAKRIEDAAAEYSHELPSQLKATLFSNTACFYVIDENYEGALRLVNTLLKETSTSFKADIHFFARIFQLLIHFEMENYDLLEYITNSTYKFFKEQNAIHKAEALLFEFFKKAVKLDESQTREAFGELAFRLKKTESDPNTGSLQAMFDFISWAESRAGQRKLSDLVRQKYTT